MTDLDTLRRALRSGGEPMAHGDVDLAPIMARGRRMRLRRHLAAAGGAVGIAAAALAVALGATQLARPSLTPGQPPAAPGRVLSPKAAPTLTRAPAPSTPSPWRSATTPRVAPTPTPTSAAAPDAAPSATPSASSTSTPGSPTMAPSPTHR